MVLPCPSFAPCLPGEAAGPRLSSCGVREHPEMEQVRTEKQLPEHAKGHPGSFSLLPRASPAWLKQQPWTHPQSGMYLSAPSAPGWER